MTAIEAKGVSVDFGRVRALHEVTLTVSPGATFGLVGESGSGKTTLMRAVLGLEPLSAGEVRLFGEPLLSGAAGVRVRARIVQAMLQDPVASLSPRRRIGQQLDEAALVLGETRAATRARAEELFHRLGLPAVTLDKYPHEISGGQARRVCAIRALLMQPKVLFADEPTAGLDVSVQGDLLNLLQDLKAEFGLTLVIVSHNLAAVRMLSDEIAVMHKGRLVEIGPATRVLGAPEQEYTAKLLAAWPRVGDRRVRALEAG